MSTRTIFILGGSGRIGSQVFKTADRHGYGSLIVPRAVYSGWDREQADIYFRSMKLAPCDVVLSASGIINQSENDDEIHQANFEVASGVCEAVSNLGARAVSLGTVLEEAIPAEKQNAYVRSKYALASAAKNKWLHLQLHTVYGGKAPDNFMFLGQIFDALQKEHVFSMTSGRQLREYHHVEDAADAIFHLIDNAPNGTVHVTDGRPISLRNIAETVFEHFGRLDLLKIGDLQTPEAEAFRPVYGRQELLGEMNFRDALPGIIDWMGHFLNKAGKK